jgi:hypothetical protein
MTEQALFPEYPTLGRQGEKAIERYLAEIDAKESDDEGLDVTAAEPPEGLQLPPSGLFKPRLYEYTEHAFGFFEAGEGDTLRIDDARNIVADASLRNQALKITMDKLRVADYPGKGMHHILVDFYAQHQTQGADEPIHFTQKFRAREQQGAGISGYPIFLGLRAGVEGLSFKVFHG